ncbi:hypothetical protein SLEP1_g4717 [Rubroshorea leprosula]|uniref:Uncharacterized protein n=1 Tax=Rubroshorea leprosula TaxID=152421 RepID=A0AAV5HXD7_9ROSI|nr:hypothetical protein SLEP1_g4717 [Rubroshorea leprosula]
MGGFESVVSIMEQGKEGEGLEDEEDCLDLLDVNDGGFESVIGLREVNKGRGVVGGKNPWTVIGVNRRREFEGGEGGREREVEGEVQFEG